VVVVAALAAFTRLWVGKAKREFLYPLMGPTEAVKVVAFC
jgi:hypothetical protein